MFEHLLEQNEYVQKQRALGEIEASQSILVDVVRRRFPNLVELAQQRAARTTQVDVLREVIGLISIAPDEATARLILSPSAA